MNYAMSNVDPPDYWVDHSFEWENNKLRYFQLINGKKTEIFLNKQYVDNFIITDKIPSTFPVKMSKKYWAAVNWKPQKQISLLYYIINILLRWNPVDIFDGKGGINVPK